jgi:lipopolysaccharide transport system ATP-binding protein
MSSPVIQVQNLGKQYTLGKRAGSGLLRDRVAGLLRFGSAKPRGGIPPQEDFWALREVGFSVQPGEVVGIIGRNGAGKSTLLKILSRITEPTTGRIEIRGRVASLLEVGTGFHGELSGRENIYMNGAILGMTRAEIRRKFDEIVAFAEVDQFLDTPVKRYSSGMYVRLAFAVAAHLEPEILIVDEVLAVGDQEFQRKCLGKLEHVTRAEGRTVLFVSHNLASVRQLCTRAILLNRGRLALSGTPGEVISQYMQAASAPVSGPENYRHIQGDGRARIERVQLHSAVAVEAHYSVLEDVVIDLHYKIHTSTPSLDFFILIYGEDGECLAASFQRDSGQLTRPTSESGITRLTFKNPFAPGRYLVSAGIFDASRQFLDWVEFAESFHVDTGFVDGRNFDGRLGRVTLTPTWNDRWDV